MTESLTPRLMHHSAPWPTDLEDLVNRARCWNGWSFALADGEWDEGTVSGLRLLITVHGANAYHPGERRGTTFLFPVPATSFDRRSWEDWIWDRCMDVPRHEMGEALAFAYWRPNEAGEMVEVTEHPFAPFHGPGRNPNTNTRVGVDPIEVRVAQDGGRYRGWWWDGRVVHDDAAHDAHAHRTVCTPVQMMGGEG
jgi:hypothetical protein